jgi:hypothetical protein
VGRLTFVIDQSLMLWSITVSLCALCPGIYGILAALGRPVNPFLHTPPQKVRRSLRSFTQLKMHHGRRSMHGRTVILDACQPQPIDNW